MGEKTWKFAKEMKNEDLFAVILREEVFYNPAKILQLLDDNDPEVLAIFSSVRKRLEKEFLEEGGGGEAERLLGVLNAAYRNAGIVTGETVKKQQLGVMRPSKGKNLQELMRDFDEIADDGTMKPESGFESETEFGSGVITLEIEATKGLRKGLRDSMRGKIVLAAPMFRSVVESGAKTLEVGCPGFRNFPESVARGGCVMFSFQDKKAPIKVEIIRVKKYRSVDQLVDGEGDELKKLAMGSDGEEIRTNLGRIFMEHRVHEHGLIVFEFKKVK